MSTDPKSTYYDHGGIETIEILRAKLTSEQYQGYLLGNVLKYAARLNWKGASERDAEKLSLYAMWLHEELAPPPAERQEQVRERHDVVPDELRGHHPDGLARWIEKSRLESESLDPWLQPDQCPPDRPLTTHCPDGGACKHKCGLDPCKREAIE